jgi:S1-C subfamily serine protease
VRKGDIVLEVNGMPVTGVDSFVQARARNADIMEVRLRRGERILSLTVPLGKNAESPIPINVGHPPIEA